MFNKASSNAEKLVAPAELVIVKVLVLVAAMGAGGETSVLYTLTVVLLGYPRHLQRLRPRETQ